MSRFVSATNEDALAAVHVPYVLFAEFDFISGAVRVCSSGRGYTWGGNAWAALGQFVAVSDLNETTDLSGQQITFTLAGVDNSLLLTTMGENYHGRNASLYLGFLDEDENLKADPETLWEGLMDTMTVNSGPNSSTIVLSCENRLVRWAQQAGWLYTQDHQRLIDATDNYFDQVPTLVSKSLKWGDALVFAGYGYAVRGNGYIG